MKKTTKAAIFVTAAAVLYGAAAYGVTRTLMDVAMKRSKTRAAPSSRAKSATSLTARRSAPPRKSSPLRKRRRYCSKTARA